MWSTKLPAAVEQSVEVASVVSAASASAALRSAPRVLPWRAPPRLLMRRDGAHATGWCSCDGMVRAGWCSCDGMVDGMEGGGEMVDGMEGGGEWIARCES